MKERIKRKKWIYAAMLLLTAAFLSGCGSGTQDAARTAEQSETDKKQSETDKKQSETDKKQSETDKEAAVAEAETDNGISTEKTGIAGETAADGHIDFEALQEENPDIFAWLYVPGTDIDYPILQSPVSDDYYKTHTADGQDGAGGALYTEMPNMMNMCDFNTVIHGEDRGEGSLFEQLHLFEDPDFFLEHENFYIYLPDNALTYEVFAANYDEGSDILRRYDYTTYEGCNKYLEQVYGIRDMNKNIREGWEDLTPTHFLVTLNGSISEDGEKQYVVIGVLVGDAAGNIDRVILD